MTGSVLLALYPLAVWGSILLYGVRVAGLVTLTVLVLLAPVRLRLLKGAWRTWEVAGPGSVLVALVLLATFYEDRRFLLALPVLINVALLVGFVSSLAAGRMPMAERFARATAGALSPAQVSYCRGVTKVWCGFFVFNASVSLWLALFSSVESWALYTGGIAYLLMGVLFVGEYGVRRRMFG